MINRFVISCVISLISAVGSFAQEPSTCDSVFTTTEVQAIYKSGIEDLMSYTSKELAPVIAKNTPNKSLLPSSAYFRLTISNTGEVSEVEIHRGEMTDKCRNAIREKLLAMTGWRPALLNGKPVCSYYRWPISCFKWQ